MDPQEVAALEASNSSSVTSTQANEDQENEDSDLAFAKLLQQEEDNYPSSLLLSAKLRYGIESDDLNTVDGEGEEKGKKTSSVDEDMLIARMLQEDENEKAREMGLVVDTIYEGETVDQEYLTEAGVEVCTRSYLFSKAVADCSLYQAFSSSTPTSLPPLTAIRLSNECSSLPSPSMQNPNDLKDPKLVLAEYQHLFVGTWKCSTEECLGNLSANANRVS